jgi:ABC-type dipeptide/oligopeptide/nickel transport system permease component
MDAVLLFKSNWRSYLLRRILVMVLAFFIISLMILAIINIGDRTIFMPSNILPFDDIIQLSEKYHWNDPVLVQYFYWIGDFFTGDWGFSLYAY